MKKKVPVGELQFGMYVAELDRPWTETPFKFQGFMLQTHEELETLGAYCREVLIDLEHRQAASTLTVTVPPRARAKVDLTRSGVLPWNDVSPVEHEYPRAAATYGAAHTVVRECIEALHSGKSFDAHKLHDAVGIVTESVLRNPDAMLLFSKLREKGDYTESHALDCSIYMAAFGRFLQMSRDDIVLLAYLGLLQDVGKTRLPTLLLNKPGRLTTVEYHIAQKHVAYSAEILRATPGLPRGLPELAMLHHERLDGSGYPRGLKGAQIGLMGSIAAIVDTFAAITAERPYASPISPSEALKILYKARGILFDAYLIEQFIRCIGIFPLGSAVELDGGEVAIVVAQNRAKRLQPRVMVFQDSSGHPIRPQKLIDLSRGLAHPDGQDYRIRRALAGARIPIGAMDLSFGPG